jgi:hypothetical protein
VGGEAVEDFAEALDVGVVQVCGRGAVGAGHARMIA